MYLVPPLMQDPPHGVDVLATEADATEERSNQQPQPTPYLAVEEVSSSQHVHMYTDELPPRHGLFALRSWWDAVPFQDVAYGLVADRITHVDQSTHDTVIAPRAVLPGHPHHQVFDLLVHARTPKRLAVAWRCDPSDR